MRGARYLLVGVLAGLAGCGGHYLLAEREPWRHEAEAECLNSGAVKEGPGKVRISAIQGPGMCGADFPFKITSLGSGAPLSFGDELRPPGAIPQTGGAPPRWPITPQPSAAPPASSAVTRGDLPPPDDDLYPPRINRPLSLDPSGNPNAADAPEPYDFRRPYGTQKPAPARSAASPPPAAGSPYDFSPVPYERRQVIGEPVPRAAVPSAPALGPARLPPPPPGPVAVNPAATLACPLVSVLDRWIDEAVQPAALKWIGVPVIEIKQISAYSCRGMNGDPNATISEHAFGNALDIAAFTFADGRRIDVEHGWHGAPEEQAFLHEVQGGACEQFTTVLAPGYNVYHYNHIHVDLMRRRNGRRACQPAPVSGDEVAARLGFHVAARRIDPSVTGSIAARHIAPPPKQPPKPLRASSYSDRKSDRDLPEAIPGADGAD
jgi:hypothetical protein